MGKQRKRVRLIEKRVVFQAWKTHAKAMNGFFEAISGANITDPWVLREIPEMPPPPYDGSANINFIRVAAVAIATRAQWALRWLQSYLENMIFGGFGLWYTEPNSPIYGEWFCTVCEALEQSLDKSKPAEKRVAKLAREFVRLARTVHALGTIEGQMPGFIPRQWRGSITLCAGDRGKVTAYSQVTVGAGRDLGFGGWRRGVPGGHFWWTDRVSRHFQLRRGGTLLDPELRGLLRQTVKGLGLFKEPERMPLPSLRTRLVFVNTRAGRASWIDTARNGNTPPLLGWVVEKNPQGVPTKATQLQPHGKARGAVKQKGAGSARQLDRDASLIEIEARAGATVQRASLPVRVDGADFVRVPSVV